MTNHVTYPRSKRSAAFSIFAVFSMLGALIAATPGAASGATENDPTIMEIQGTGHLSPMVGETVTTSGIVTAVAFSGFYMQDPKGDGDDNTSDGIFVSSSSAVDIGDEVDVTGTVEENIGGGPATGNLSVTRIVGDASILSSGNDLPAPVEIGRRGRRPGTDIVISDSELPTNLQTDPAVSNPDIDAIDFYETLEGMYVEIDRPVAVSATRQFSPFSSEVFTVPSRGRTVSPRNARTWRGGILLQAEPDNLGDSNPERVQIQFDSNIYPDTPPSVKVGDRMNDVRGVVGYSFGNYEVNATEVLRTHASRLRPEASHLRIRRNRVNVASYNVLNLSPDESDDAQRAKLAAQIVNQLRSPDVIALQEIQDNSGELDDGTTAADLTLQKLIDAISAAGGPVYTAIDGPPVDGTFGGIPGGNIRNAFLYNDDRVDLLDTVSMSEGLLESLGAPDPLAFDGSRDPLVGLFSFDGTPFTVVNVHNTSRFGSTPIFGGPQPFVQAGEAAREAQAEALNFFTDLLVADHSDAIVMVVGDFNTFEWTDDLTEILPGDRVLTNLMTTRSLNFWDRKNRYTFIFEGNSQALDHFFVTGNLRSWYRSQLDIVHANVDFSRLLDDVTASDHEPLLGRFRLPKSSGPTTLPDAPEPDGLRLQVLHASDLEGGVDALSRAANFAAIVDALEDSEEVDASVTISAGDNYIPGPFFGASGDRSMREVFQAVYNQLNGRDDLTNIRETDGRGDITIMNIIGFDASALGNHEFDAGTGAIAAIIGEDVRGTTPGDIRWTGADFPYLSANLDFSADGSLSGLFTSDLLENVDFVATPDELLAGASPPKIAPSTFVTVEGGERIGVVGATTQLLASISSPGATTVIGPNANNMGELAAILQPEIDALEAAGINKIIVTSHLQQLSLEEELATLLDGVDIIIAGGSDSLLANDDDELRDGDTADREYPVVATDAGGGTVAIVSTDGEYSYVGRLVLEFDADGNIVGSTDPALNGPIKTEDEDVADLWGSTEAAFAEGTKANLVQVVVEAIRAVVIEKDGTVVGETTVYLDGRRSQVRTEETNFGNLSADANLAVAQAHDASVVLSLKNGGGIRAPIGEIDSNGNFLPPQGNPATGKLDGQISQLDIENTLRFNNNLVLLNVTAAELLGLIEHAVAATEPGATPGQFGQIGGAQFVYDASATPGSRIVSLALEDGGVFTPIVNAGAFVVPEETVYRIVTLGFLAGGGDSYPFPEDLTDPAVDFVALDAVLTDLGAFNFAAPGTEQDALAEFLNTNHGIGDGTPFDMAETPISEDTRIVEASFAD